MGPQRLSWFIGLSAIVFSFGSLAQNSNMNPETQKQCLQLQEKLNKNPKIKTGTIEVPEVYEPPSAKKISIHYWVREKLKLDTDFPPLLLIHGGVGGNSSGMLSWSETIDNYPGDVVSLDLRGEGCSNYFGYNEHHSFYHSVTIKSTILDLEHLRQKLYPKMRWRYFGQSRGSAIGHRYLEAFPEALESVHVHGLAMMSEEDYPNYSIMRSFFNARAGRTFYSQYPDAGAVINDIRRWLTQTSECFSVNYALLNLPKEQQPQVCGAQVIDAFSGRLGVFGGWPAFAKSLTALKNVNGELDVTGARQLLQSALDSSLYIRYLGYIFGTNSQEFHAPDLKALREIEKIDSINSAPLSEGRFILKVALPLYRNLHGDNVVSNHKFYDFEKVRTHLQNRLINNDPLQLRVYFGEYDPVAGPEAFSYEQNQLKGLAEFILIEKSAHDGWKTHAIVAENLLKR